MAVYDGPPLPAGSVSLVQPEGAALTSGLSKADLAEEQKRWYERAAQDASILYFGIDFVGRAIGQVFLHDIDERTKEALVGYHLFRPGARRKGFGTAALRALCDYAFGTLDMKRLVIITSLDNAASRRIAEKCGFRETGAPREGPDLIAFERVAPLPP
jgi:RimJ/RimL family protein N-acetyltransferase